MRFTWLYPLALACAGTAGAADISVSGQWSKVVTRNDLNAGAGSDLTSPIESSSATATLDITNTAGASWLVRVASSEIDWPPGASVAVRRSGSQCGIDGGMTYVMLSGAAQNFFSGTGDCLGIEIQLSVSGLSIHTAPSPYTLLITYSVQSPAL